MQAQQKSAEIPQQRGEELSNFTKSMAAKLRALREQDIRSNALGIAGKAAVLGLRLNGIVAHHLEQLWCESRAEILRTKNIDEREQLFGPNIVSICDSLF